MDSKYEDSLSYKWLVLKRQLAEQEYKDFGGIIDGSLKFLTKIMKYNLHNRNK